MNYYSLKYGLSASVSQTELMQLLKSNNCEVIQTSDGLCVRSEQSMQELQSLAQQKEATGINISQIDKAAALESPETPVDVKTFLQTL